MENKIEDLVPVYLSFSTFQSAVSSLREHGLPSKIDKSAFSTRSGADQSQIISALKFMGFIDNEDNTQPSLKKIIGATTGSKEEKDALIEVIKNRYSKVFEFDLTTATIKQIINAIGEYGSTGSTKDRAVRFFIKICEYCDIPLSTRLTQNTRSRTKSTNTAGKTSNQKTRKKKKIEGVDDEPPIPNKNEAMKTISLPGAGGTLTISGTFNFFGLVGDERELVYGIIDKMTEHENKPKTK